MIAGEYTAPPAHGPMIAEICGTTPLRQHVAQEDVGVAGERLDALLDPRAARVVEADHRAADLGREIHHLADLLRVRARQRSAEHREVLREHAHGAAVDGAVPGDHAVAEDLLLLHAEVGAAMRDELVELDEAALVEQRRDALARGELAGLVLLRRCGPGRRRARPWPPSLRGDGSDPGIGRFVAGGHGAAYSRGVANVKGSALTSRVLWVQLEHGEAGVERLAGPGRRRSCAPASRTGFTRRAGTRSTCSSS